jgi:hypothetical protein
MTNTAFRRSASAVIAGLLKAVGAAVSVPPAHCDPENDLAEEYCLDATAQGYPSWLAGYNLQHGHGWTQTETIDFTNGAVPVYCPKL